MDELLHLCGSAADGAARDNTWEIQAYIHFQDNQGVTVTIRPEHRVEDILTLACKVMNGFCCTNILLNRLDHQCHIPVPSNFVQCVRPHFLQRPFYYLLVDRFSNLHLAL